MKTIQNLSNSSALYHFLYKIIGRKAIPAVSNLAEFRIETVHQLIGLIQRRIPRVSEKTAKIKGLTKAGLAARKKIQSELIITQLQSAMKTSRTDTVKVYNKCIRANCTVQHYNYNSGWAFGSVFGRQTKRAEDKFWFVAPKIKIKDGFFVVPAYKSTGPVFDQGERGTCVANAFCSLIDYLAEMQSSRQFFYHQAKMIDGIPDVEGTYIETAARILCDNTLCDIGTTEDSIWPYNPHPKETPHQGPPPEKAFNTKRFFSISDPVFIRENSKVKDIKYLLNNYGDVTGINSQEDKTCLVVIGVALHESFFSWNTSDTGWVTMPLPGEAIVGYHAMAICGYDDDRRLFLVRNSWGPHWAHNNDRGYNGHAWIPYEYIDKYCHVGVSITGFNTEYMAIPESERLYNNVLISRYAGRIAAFRKERQKAGYRSRKPPSISRWLFRIAVIVFLGYTFQGPVIKLKDRLIHVLEKHFDLDQLKNKVTDFFEDSKLNN